MQGSLETGTAYTRGGQSQEARGCGMFFEKTEKGGAQEDS